jgi:two-component system, NtrC family, sensor histidine kinase HydH
MIPGDLNALVAEAVQLIKGQADDQGVSIETHLATDLPQAAISPPAILQILRNLTANALQAMTKGGKLVLSTRTLQGRRWVVVEVKDTGPGLPENLRPHLFDPFFTTKPDGAGLGLAIAREITLAHRGELRAEPSHGEPGAIFTLSLPAVQKRVERPVFSEATAVR